MTAIPAETLVNSGFIHKYTGCKPQSFVPGLPRHGHKYGKENTFQVYRVGKYGNDKKTAFLNYYEEVIKGLKTVRNPQKYIEKCKKDIDRLSISCYCDIKDISFYFEVTLKDTYPEKVLLKGITDPQCGLSQLTKERKDVTDSHVDWWLYENAQPWNGFEEAHPWYVFRMDVTDIREKTKGWLNVLPAIQ